MKKLENLSNEFKITHDLTLRPVYMEVGDPRQVRLPA